MIKNKLKELLNELKKIKVETILVLEYKKGNDRKIFHSRAKLIASGSDIDETFESMYQNIMMKIKIRLLTFRLLLKQLLLKHSIKNFEC